MYNRVKNLFVWSAQFNIESLYDFQQDNFSSKIEKNRLISLSFNNQIYQVLTNYRKSTGFGHPFQLQSKIKNTPRLKCDIFFTLSFELKILLLIAPIVKNVVQLKVGFFLKKPRGPISYAEHLTWAPQIFYSINYIIFLT